VAHEKTDWCDGMLECPEFWRAVIMRLGLNPMASAYSIKDISAENGVDPERAFAKFRAHFHRSDSQH
jgi:hypothetical protein